MSKGSDRDRLLATPLRVATTLAPALLRGVGGVKTCQRESILSILEFCKLLFPEHH